MSKLADKLRKFGIVNCHDMLGHAAKGKDVACSYVTPDTRGCRPPETMVWSPSHKTDPAAAWYNYGKKAFLGNRAESMPRAMAWASEHYGIAEWVTCPTDVSSKIPKAVLDAVLKALKAADAPKKCDYHHREFCNGKDIRAVIPRRHDKESNRYFYDMPVQNWCAGCRELNNGGFKYATSKA